eukprot:jgi/Galph1/4025/GphlegSOOS_G2656.1
MLSKFVQRAFPFSQKAQFPGLLSCWRLLSGSGVWKPSASLISLKGDYGRPSHAEHGNRQRGFSENLFVRPVNGIFLVFGACSLFWYYDNHVVRAELELTSSDEWKEQVEEPVTRTIFPKWLTVYEKNEMKRERLLGAGPRYMTPLRVKVYAVGVYIDEKEAKPLLSSFKFENAEDLSKDEKFWKLFSSPKGQNGQAFGKVFRMVCIREVPGKHMQNGFDRGLLKRVREADKKMGMLDGKQALKQFNQCFLEKGVMPVGCELLFVCSAKEGTVDTWIDGVHYGQVKNDALSWALCDMFLGMKPVSREIKEEVSQGCYAWLQQE